MYIGNKDCSDSIELDCKNGATCRVQNGEPFCACQEGYEGRKCQFSTVNLDTPIQNVTGKQNLKGVL